MPSFRSFAFLIVLLVLGALASTQLSSCTLLGGLFSESPMTDEEFQAWLPAAVDEVFAGAQAAVQEGDLAPAQVAAWSVALRDIGEGQASVPGSLVSVLGLEGYPGLAASLAVSNLQARAARAGWWGSNGLGASRARIICAALGARLEPLGSS